MSTDDPELAELELAERYPDRGHAPKRYFKVDYGIDYTIVARDAQHAIQILAASDGDYAETYRELGPPEPIEIPAEQAAAITIFDEEQTPSAHVPLTSLPLGTCASSEF